jgi:branched-chain amino acid transport system permease protein
MAGRPHESRDLTSLTLDGHTLSETHLFFLVRYWLATPEGRAADPAPLGDLSALPVVPHAVAYGLQMALGGLPLASIYALLAAAYSLVYALIGRITRSAKCRRRWLRRRRSRACHARLAAAPC